LFAALINITLPLQRLHNIFNYFFFCRPRESCSFWISTFTILFWAFQTNAWKIMLQRFCNDLSQVINVPCKCYWGRVRNC